MQKLYSHNQKTDTKVFSKGQQISKKQTVDINKLLNRVKINQKNEKKKKIIYCSFTILGLSLLAMLITFMK